MTSDKVVPAVTTSDIGTPGDYTEDLYRFYIEFKDVPGAAECVIKNFLGSERAHLMQKITHGIQIDMPIQCAPDVIKLLAHENVAIYQVVRYAKVDGNWR